MWTRAGYSPCIWQPTSASLPPTQVASGAAAPGGPYVLYVGGLSSPDPRKDVAGLIDAFESWRAAGGREERLVLAGQLGVPGEQMQARVEREGARVRFAGFVPDDDLPGLYSGASCFVTASRYEGFGLPALEAISCATPVAAFDAGAVPEVAGREPFWRRPATLRR